MTDLIAIFIALCIAVIMGLLMCCGTVFEMRKNHERPYR